MLTTACGSSLSDYADTVPITDNETNTNGGTSGMPAVFDASRATLPNQRVAVEQLLRQNERRAGPKRHDHSAHRRR
jgi:hypothetical protein